MDYVIISRSSYDAVTKRVIQLCSKGWKPQGGVSVTATTSMGCRDVIYAQAMIKEIGGVTDC